MNGTLCIASPKKMAREYLMGYVFAISERQQGTSTKNKRLDYFVEKDLLMKKLSDRHGSCFAGRLLIAKTCICSFFLLYKVIVNIFVSAHIAPLRGAEGFVLLCSTNIASRWDAFAFNFAFCILHCALLV